MVSTATIVSVVITFCISMVLPILIFVIYGVKNKGKGVWSAWFLGAAGFFVMQIIIRTPILNLVATTQGFMSFVTRHFVIYCLVLAFTAALFEVIARYVVARIMSEKLTFTRGIAAGLGHGGIEAILVVGMTYLSNLMYIGMINGGTFDSIVEQTAALGADTSSLLVVKESLLQANPGIFLLAGYERILTMIFQVALSLLVCYYVSRKEDWKGILICLLCHWIVDFVSPLINGCASAYMGNLISTKTAYVIIYAFLTAVVVVSVLGIMKIKKKWNQKDENISCG